MASKTQLRTLTLDGIRPILSYVDLPSLVKLFATLDRNIIKLLFSPGAFSYLRIEPIGTIPRVLYRNFLGSLRNVHHLDVQSNVLWSAPTLSLLTTLNPRSLSIGSAFLHSSVFTLLADLKKHPEEQSLAHMARFLLPNGFPNFALLVPRLETIDLPEVADLVKKSNVQFLFNSAPLEFHMTFPPTLTSATLQLPPKPFPIALLDALPSTLRALTVDHNSQDIMYAEDEDKFDFGRFTQLEYLWVEGARHFVNRLEVPPTLQTLAIETNCTPWDFLRHPSLKASKLTRMTILIGRPGHKTEDPIDLAQLLPSSLICLKLQISGDLGIASLPPSLIEFELIILDGSSDEHIFTLIDGLRSLKELKVELSNDERDDLMLRSIVKGTLPTSLTKLTLGESLRGHLTKAQIQKLPLTLRSLYIPAWPLATVEDFHAHLPNCHLFITEHVWYWSPMVDGYLREKFKHLWVPAFDVNLYFDELRQYYHALNAHFKLELHLAMADVVGAGPSPETKRLVHRHQAWSVTSFAESDHFFAHQSCWTMFPALEYLNMNAMLPSGNFSFISFLPATLTYLDLNDSTCELSLHRLPTSLTHLSAGRHTRPLMDGSTMVPSTRLKFIDTPTLELRHSVLASWRNLDTLHATIIELADYNVVPFLTTVVGRKTRLNMKVSIKYHTTGALIPDEGPESLEFVTWSSICEATAKILRRELASPMPAIDSDSDLNNSSLDTLIEGDTIGRVVASLTSYNLVRTLHLPGSAKRAQISSKREFTLIPLPTLLPKHNDGLYKTEFGRSSSSDYSAELLRENTIRPNWSKEVSVFPIGSRLTRLELLGSMFRAFWLESLPHSLKYLRISGKDILNNVTGPFPPRLTTLIIEESLVDPMDADFLRFSLAALPRSLQHLAITTGPFELHILKAELKLKIDLPFLKTVRVSCVTDVGMIQLTRLLPRSQLSKFEYELVAYKVDRGSPPMRAQFSPHVLLGVEEEDTSVLIDSITGITKVDKIDISDLLAQFDAAETEDTDSDSPSSVASSLASVQLSPIQSTGAESGAPSSTALLTGFPVRSEGSASTRRKAVRMPRK